MTEETSTQTNNDGASDSKTDTTPGKGGQQQTTDAKFTQADLDHHAGERARRASEAAINKLLADLGVKSADELKTTLEEKRKRDEADMSEAEKQTKALQKEQAERARIEAELEKEREARKQEKLDNAIRAAAKGAHDPDDVIRILRSDFADAVAKALKDDGTVDTAALDKLMTDLKKKKAYLFGGTGSPGSPSNHGGKAPEPDAKKKEEARTFLRRQMRRSV